MSTGPLTIGQVTIKNRDMHEVPHPSFLDVAIVNSLWAIQGNADT